MGTIVAIVRVRSRRAAEIGGLSRAAERVTFDLAPVGGAVGLALIGAAFGLAALGAIFRHGERLQRETVGLV